MGRQAREYSSTGFYHVVFRGINHQHIFEEPSDYDYMLEIVRQLKTEMAFEVHAYGDNRDVPVRQEAHRV